MVDARSWKLYHGLYNHRIIPSIIFLNRYYILQYMFSFASKSKACLTLVHEQPGNTWTFLRTKVTLPSESNVSSVFQLGRAGNSSFQLASSSLVSLYSTAWPRFPVYYFIPFSRSSRCIAAAHLAAETVIIAVTTDQLFYLLKVTFSLIFL